MKYLDEYRDGPIAAGIVAEIRRIQTRPWVLMEVCGGQTHSIVKHGIDHLLPAGVELVHGPGCPVCVTPLEMIDKAHKIAQHPNVIFCSFGDMLRVPGSDGDLFTIKSRGGDVRVVYSPLDCLKIARGNPEKQVVFFAIGFETTAPSTAVTLLRAKAENIQNFFIFCNHVTIIPAMKAILDSPDLRLDGFIGPGHVSMVIGLRPYTFVARDHHKPVVMAGFEPLDIIQAVHMIVTQISEGRAEIENQYARVVRPEGNTKALEAMARTMELRPFFEWRGLGFITHSALKLRPEFADWDAELRFQVPGLRIADPKACQCGEVLKGVIKPWECKVFGTACTPETPIGTCMVSPEGACAAYFNYGRFSMASERNRLRVLPARTA